MRATVTALDGAPPSFLGRPYRAMERAWPGAGRSLVLGFAIALVAISLRLVVGSEVGRDQIVFSYPAVLLATMLFGTRAGGVTAAVCVLVAWYYVIPPSHSFALQDMAAATTLGIATFTSAALVVVVGAMRGAVTRYELLAAGLEQRVERRTAERNRLWAHSPDLIAVVRRDGTLRDYNATFDALLARAAPGASGVAALLPPDARAGLASHLARLSRDTPEASFETRVLARDGPAWVRWTATLDSGDIYLVGHDITAERICHDQLRQARRMEAVGQMTGGMAHDFGNLLMPIRIGLDLASRRMGGDARLAVALEAGQASVDRAEALIARLMAFARHEAGPAERIDPGERLRALAPLLRQSVGGRMLALSIAEPLPQLRLDPGELDGALLNLVVNARDASPEGSTVTLSAHAQEGRVILTVADEGEGMAADTLARAREPFFSTKRPGEGTGLGLAMVQRFVDGAGGRLLIDSAPGAGTRVSLDLPPA